MSTRLEADATVMSKHMLVISMSGNAPTASSLQHLFRRANMSKIRNIVPIALATTIGIANGACSMITRSK